MRVLLVEDDDLLADAAQRALHTQGWIVDRTQRGEPVALSLRRDPYDIAILDVGLPGIDGFETLQRVRREGILTPILMLTARDAVEDRVRGLNSGADDYLVKPFAMQELIARMRTLTQRHRDGPGMLSIGGLHLDLGKRSATVCGAQIALSGREWEVIAFLVERAGKAVAKAQIADSLSEATGAATDNLIEVYVSRLRPRLAPAGIVIRTVRGFGYLLEEAGGDGPA
ncbi:MAG TPA: response regulator transcription factor [Rubrivivax sp.]|nr:response regulator transcription factor [Rubrivivax sp.]HPO17890.1 response regulator transcription factor [Rubrivivax sp.]